MKRETEAKGDKSTHTSSSAGIRANYPHDRFEIGIPYNGDIQAAFANGWNRGTRITLYPLYPMVCLARKNPTQLFHLFFLIILFIYSQRVMMPPHIAWERQC